MNTFYDKVLLVTGGTGSFGNALVKKILPTNVAEIRIFSRDEKKQDDMRRFYKDSRIKFYIGDARDVRSINAAISNVDYIFHSAALKQVPSCEFHPIEAVNTNILGTNNVLDAAIHFGVKKVVCLSTDKAVYPINAMGISKAMMEKVMVAKSRSSSKTLVCATRYGNVMGSRGSVIPLFANQIRLGHPITITDEHMTRFMMTLEDAVELVLYAFEYGNSGDIFVQKSPASTIAILAKSLADLLGAPNHQIDIIGTRHGEKLFEVLLSREEMALARDLGEYYCVPPDLRDLNYTRYVERGDKKITEAIEYNSHNTRQLDVHEMKLLLGKLSFIKAAKQGQYLDPDF